MIRRWYRRLLCRLGYHRWMRFPLKPGDPPYTHGYRECRRCRAREYITDPP